jgi:hypothetical protein
MNNPLNMDLPARADLLAYLVSSHLLARQLTGNRLSPEHVVESTTGWLRANDAGADVTQRAMLSSRALEVAQEWEIAQSPASKADRDTALFHANLRLDFRSETARAIYHHCLTRLAGAQWF